MNAMRIWIPPILLAGVTLAGLIGALLVDGPVGSLAGVVGLGTPVATVLRKSCLALGVRR